MTTPLEFLPPRSLPVAEHLAELRSALDRRTDVAAVYCVTARYLEPPETLQDELEIELADPPGENGAPAELFREFANVLSSTRGAIIFTFPPTSVLPRVREAGIVIWERRS